MTTKVSKGSNISKTVSCFKAEDIRIVIFEGVRSSLQSHPLWVNLYITEPIPYHITVVDQMTAPIVCVQSIYLSDKETSSGQTTRPPKYVISADIVHMFGGKEQPQLYKDIYILSGSL